MAVWPIFWPIFWPIIDAVDRVRRSIGTSADGRPRLWAMDRRDRARSGPAVARPSRGIWRAQPCVFPRAPNCRFRTPGGPGARSGLRPTPSTTGRRANRHRGSRLCEARGSEGGVPVEGPARSPGPAVLNRRYRQGGRPKSGAAEVWSSVAESRRTGRERSSSRPWQSHLPS